MCYLLYILALAGIGFGMVIEAVVVCDIGVECISKRTGSGQNVPYSLERCNIDAAGTIVNVTLTWSKSSRGCRRQESLCAAFSSLEVEVFDFSDNAVCVSGGCQASFNVCAVFPTPTSTIIQSALETTSPLSVPQTPISSQMPSNTTNVKKSTTQIAILKRVTDTTVLMPQTPSTARVSTFFTSLMPSTDRTTTGKWSALTEIVTNSRSPRTTNTLSVKSSNVYSTSQIFTLTGRTAATGPLTTTTKMSVSTTIAQTITATNVFRKTTATPVWKDTSQAITTSQDATTRKLVTSSEPTDTYFPIHNGGFTVDAAYMTNSTVVMSTETKTNQPQTLTKVTTINNSIAYLATTISTEYTVSFTTDLNDNFITNTLGTRTIAGIVSGGLTCLMIIGIIGVYMTLSQDKCSKVSTSTSSG